MRIVVAVTGASGVVVGYRLARWLHQAGHRVWGIETRAARKVRGLEAPEESFPAEVPVYREDDFMAPVSSSSFLFDAMVIAPCSLRSLAAVAQGWTGTLVARAADVALRSGRKLVVAPRETPLSAAALENMLRCRREGALVAPLMMAYYNRPASVEEVTGFLTGKLLDLLGLENDLYRRWTGREGGDDGS